ncbi:TBC1 domain family member 2A-like isoform X1 [Anguilla anguilla]|uniref:TBC1 domain family member 2A-like isoform X1 n=2 Tax=Anguilla anguilla TaxID=7936 RepID=UPI0015B0AE80|nr:TBC1 domain family member 2A-like isoform X1 [Anguilla anguilla]XP_035273015.1 TBC1 domain family member 2A-like isoform X1 [Anguilla anguilla]
MEADGPEGKSGATQPQPTVDCDVTAVLDSDPPTVDCDVTALPTSDPHTLDCDVTVVQNSDLHRADCGVTAVPISGPPTVDRDLAVGEGVDLSGVGEDVAVGNAGGTPHADVLRRFEKQPPEKLCGYLHKLGGPLKGWKSRWFVYEERSCQLLYYRMAQDASPLGHIQLTNATFDCPLQADEGTFHIQTPQRTFVLKAVNREAMIYWLQQLQLRRWRHREATGQTAQVCAGADRKGSSDGLNFCSVDFLPIMKPPAGLVGEEAAQQPAPRQQAALCNVSFKHPFTEIQNSVRSLRLNRVPQEPSRSVFHYDLSQETTPTDPESPAPKTQGTQNATVTSSLLPAPQREDSDEVRRSRSPSPNLQTRKNRTGTSASLPSDWTQNRMSQLRQDVHTLSEELRIQKELVRLLHQALEEAQREKRRSSHLVSEEKGEEGEEKGEEARVSEWQVVKLTAELQTLRSRQGALERTLAERDGQVVELQQHVELMVEKNRAKQEVVLQLSEQVEACLADPLRPVTNNMETTTFRQLQEEIHQLRDDIAAYKTQNQFLNSEIYQLTQLWRKSSEQEKNLMMKCAYLESRNFQKERRYLGLLRALQESHQLDSSQQEEVDKLIEEALLGDIKDRLRLNPIREYDSYGFKLVPDFDVEDVKLLAKIQALDFPSHNLLRREDSGGCGPLGARWAQYLSGCPAGDLAPSPELKALLRAGVPVEHRRRAWQWLVRERTCSLRDRHPQRYRDMLEKSRATPHPASRQIQLDLHRTLIGNQHFSSPSDPAVQQLHRVLLAFSWQNPAIGYCQGLNRLAALALLVLQDEEEAFWCLVAVVETVLPQDYYGKTLAGSQADQRVLKDLMVEKLPRLTAHLEELEVDVSLITFNWFLVVFIESLTTNILLRIWDAFLYEGTKILFRYALALLKYREEDILKIQNKVEMYQYLRFFTKTITDSRRLMSIAFSSMNPLPIRLLRGRRALHLEKIRTELSELERIQREYVAQNAERKDKDLYAMASEDEAEG